MATLYKIRDWSRHFEVADSRKVDGPLKWVPVPTATDGYAFSALSLEKDKCELLAAWHLMLGIAAKRPKVERGQLSRDGHPLTPEDLEMITRFPARIFARAFEFFATERIGWLVAEAIGANQSELGLSTPSEPSPAPSGHAPATGYDRIGYDRIGQEGATNAAPVSDSEWLASLKSNPAYVGIDVDREHGKMLAWCQVNRKQPTRRRFITWLNRAERPLEGGSPKFGKTLPAMR